MNGRALAIAIVTLVVIVAAWKISEDKAPETEVVRSEFLPALLDHVNDVTAVALRSAEHSTRLVRDGDSWHLADKDDFPADGVAVRRTLLQLAALRTVEAKTRSPERYARIGVQAIDSDGADGTRVDIQAGGDAPLVSLIVGHARGAGEREQHYVRRTDEAQSWLVDGPLQVPADPIPWLDAAIVDIDTGRVRSVSIEVPGANPVVVEKDKPEENFFTLQGVPDGFKAKSRATVSSVGAVLLDLRLNDVAAASRVAGQEAVRKTTVRTFDGLVVTLRDYTLEGVTWTAFDFAYDADGVIAPKPAAKSDEPPVVPIAGKDDAGGDDAAGGDDSDKADAAADKTESTADEARRLAARTAGWVYVLPNYKRRMLERDFDSLVEAGEEQAGGGSRGEPAAAPGGSSE